MKTVPFLVPFVLVLMSCSGGANSSDSSPSAANRAPVPTWMCQDSVDMSTGAPMCGCTGNHGASSGTCGDFPCCWQNNVGQPSCDCFMDQGAACETHRENECGQLAEPDCGIVPYCPQP